MGNLRLVLLARDLRNPTLVRKRTVNWHGVGSKDMRDQHLTANISIR